jgi:hypothetical protein
VGSPLDANVYGSSVIFLWTSYSDSGIILRMDVLIDIFARVFVWRRPEIGTRAGRPYPPPILRNEAICNVGEIVFMRHGEKELRRLQKNDKWLRFGAKTTSWTAGHEAKSGEPREATRCPMGLHETACQEAGDGGSIRDRLE